MWTASFVRSAVGPSLGDSQLFRARRSCFLRCGAAPVRSIPPPFQQSHPTKTRPAGRPPMAAKSNGSLDLILKVCQNGEKRHEWTSRTRSAFQMSAQNHSFYKYVLLYSPLVRSTQLLFAGKYVLSQEGGFEKEDRASRCGSSGNGSGRGSWCLCLVSLFG